MVDALFEPISIGELQVDNRVVMPPMTTHYATEDGHATDQTVEYYRERGKGGTGLIVFEATYPCEPHPDRHLLTRDEHVETLARVTEAVHDAGSKIAAQLNPSRATGDEYERVAPSEVTVPMEDLPEDQRHVRGLDAEEIEEFIESFGEGAARAEQAGFDGIEIHGASGYLVQQFLSPLTNRRDDEYGGDLEGRTKFARDLIAAAHRETESDLPVWLRMSGDEFLDGGYGRDEARRIAARLQEAGSAAFHVTAGHQWGEGQAYGVLSGYEPRALNVDVAENVREAVDVPVMAVGRINDPQLAADIVESGQADLAAMGRAHIADPHFVRKAKNGDLDRIRRCVGGLEGCRDMVFPNYPETLSSGMGVTCTVNAHAGHEYEIDVEDAEETKQVAVVGGGPAGLEAARTAASRGHDVTVYERSDRVGGQVRWMANSVTKPEHRTLLEFFEAELDAYDVEVQTGTEIDPGEVEDLDADHVVVAVGSSPEIPTIEGLTDAVTDGRVLTVDDVLADDPPEIESAIILGGSESAVDVAVTLREDDVPSTVVVRPDEDLLPLRSPITKKGFRKRLDHPLITLLMETSVREVTDDGVRAFDAETDEERAVEGETIVLAQQRQANTQFAERLEVSVPVETVGDATSGTGLHTAIHEGAEVGRSI